MNVPKLRLLALALFVCVAGLSKLAAAHPAKSTALFLDIGSHDVQVEMHVPRDQLELALDAPPEETDLPKYLLSHLAITDVEGEELQLAVRKISWQTIDEAPHMVAHLNAHSQERVIGALTLRDKILLHKVVSHKIYVTLRGDVFSPNREPRLLGVIGYTRDRLAIKRTPPSVAHSLSLSSKLGATHIFAGADHILFLFTLLLLASCRIEGGRWTRHASNWQSVVGLIRLVTAFTIGHSATLALGVLNFVELRSSWVEVAVAVTLVATSLHALRPWMGAPEIVFATGFGLVHGLAFASALDGLGLAFQGLVPILVGFTLGIEIAQLLVVALAVPFLLFLSNESFAWLRRTGALVSLIVSLFWTGERAISAFSSS